MDRTNHMKPCCRLVLAQPYTTGNAFADGGNANRIKVCDQAAAFEVGHQHTGHAGGTGE